MEERVYMKVKLLSDLTKYEEGLVPGIIGTAHLQKITFTDWEEQLVEVHFPNCTPIAIGWRSLEKLDKRYWEKIEKLIKSAYEIDYIVGPRGGFKYMRIFSRRKRIGETIETINIKHEALRCIEIGKKYGKEIKEGKNLYK